MRPRRLPDEESRLVPRSDFRDASKTEPFTHEQQIAIFNALADFPDQYGRYGKPIAAQTKAFVYVLRYTGMAIGDVAKLEKADVHGCRIRTYRKKTGEDVFAKVPQFVVDALLAAPHDSDKYFFWTGEGLLHTRTSKWGDRLRRLFKIARVEGKTPYMFRHTLARDFLEDGGSMAELAELLGNTAAVCQRIIRNGTSAGKIGLSGISTSFARTIRSQKC